MMGDKIFGVLMVTTAASTFLASALRTLVKMPNGWGLLFSVSIIASGCFVCASVIRDRL